MAEGRGLAKPVEKGEGAGQPTKTRASESLALLPAVVLGFEVKLHYPRFSFPTWVPKQLCAVLDLLQHAGDNLYGSPGKKEI